MSLFDQLGGLLQQYTGGQGMQPSAQATQDLQHVATNAPPDVVATGLSQAFRSDQTPPFSQMVSSLFTNSNPQQRAGLLNTLLSGASPGLISALGGLSGGGGLSSMLSRGGSISPDQAANVDPAAVEQLAHHAEQQNPSIVDNVSHFYAQHPALVSTVGKVAATIAMAGIANHLVNRNA